MTHSSVPSTRPMPAVLPISQAAVWLSIAAFLGLAAYYFIGIDEGAMSVFGPSTMVVHEFVHDARHFLGFPCH